MQKRHEPTSVMLSVRGPRVATRPPNTGLELTDGPDGQQRARLRPRPGPGARTPPDHRARQRSPVAHALGAGAVQLGLDGPGERLALAPACFGPGPGAGCGAGPWLSPGLGWLGAGLNMHGGSGLAPGRDEQSGDGAEEARRRMRPWPGRSR